jgi:hypothetical protein
MSKSNKYGYSGVDIPTQAFQANVGKFDPAEINELVQEDKWTQYGQLELIETQSVTSAQNVDFTSLGDYDVHLLTVNDHTFPAGSQDYGIRLYENGVLETANEYEYAYQQNGVTGGVYENKSTGANHIRIDNTGSEQWVQNWYCYFYNLLDSSKYSYVTFQQVPKRLTSGGSYNSAGTYAMFGSGVMKQASAVDGIRVYDSSQTASAGTLSLYGIRYS